MIAVIQMIYKYQKKREVKIKRDDNMTKRYYERYRPADTWEQLGLIGDTLSFTDDEIVTQQAIGYTKHLCDYHCPMDIAVVYSMLNQGEGATPTAKELLNDYTRLAYYFESGRVADGWWLPPTDEQPYSCSSDVDFPKVDYSTSSHSNLCHAPPIDVSKLEGLITAILEKKDATTMGYLLDAYNWEISRTQVWYLYDNQGYDEFLMADRTDNADFKALMSNGENEQVNSDKVLELIQQYIPFTMKPNSDYCTRSDDGKDYCERHRPNNDRYERHWVFKEGLPVLYHNFAIPSYYASKPHLQKNYCHVATIKFESHKRRLIDEVNDKEVLKLINKSLTRMEKRETVEQVSHGRGRMFQWTAWDWLENIRTRILASNAKQRKLGDVVNGWEYTKGNTTMSYGMEINDHDWKPVKAVHWWEVSIQVPYKNDYNMNHVYHQVTALPYMFFTEEEAQVYADSLNQIDTTTFNGVSRHRTVTKNFDVSIPTVTYSVQRKTVHLSVDGIAVIENYMTPQEMFKQMQVGNDEQYNAVAAQLRRTPSQLSKMVSE
jgi:hypothetical protein